MHEETPHMNLLTSLHHAPRATYKLEVQHASPWLCEKKQLSDEYAVFTATGITKRVTLLHITTAEKKIRLDNLHAQTNAPHESYDSYSVSCENQLDNSGPSSPHNVQWLGKSHSEGTKTWLRQDHAGQEKAGKGAFMSLSKLGDRKSPSPKWNKNHLVCEFSSSGTSVALLLFARIASNSWKTMRWRSKF